MLKGIELFSPTIKSDTTFRYHNNRPSPNRHRHKAAILLPNSVAANSRTVAEEHCAA